MHYFTPKRCATSNKIMYHDKAQVQRAADQSLIERGVELWVYRCEFCGCWHLTHRDPQSSYRHVPLNQQLKPHSRKRATSHVDVSVRSSTGLANAVSETGYGPNTSGRRLLSVQGARTHFVQHLHHLGVFKVADNPIVEANYRLAQHKSQQQ